MPSLKKHVRTVGDTRTPLHATLKQRDADGVLQAVDVTSLTIQFCMVAESGATIVALTTSNVAKVDATNGVVKYTFQDADVSMAGKYFAWFVPKDGSDDVDTFPCDGRTFEIEIVKAEGRA